MALNEVSKPSNSVFARKMGKSFEDSDAGAGMSQRLLFTLQQHLTFEVESTL